MKLSPLINASYSFYYYIFGVSDTLERHINDIEAAASNPIRQAKAYRRYLAALYTWRSNFYSFTAYMIGLEDLIARATYHGHRVLDQTKIEKTLTHVEAAKILQRAFRFHQYKKIRSQKPLISSRELHDAFPGTALCVLPKEPTENNSINQDKAKKWINAQADLFRPLAKIVIEKTKRISFSAFKKRIEVVALEFNKKLMQLPQQNQEYFLILGEGGDDEKSNTWVTSIALSFLAKLPKEIIVVQRGRQNPWQFINALEQHPNVKMAIYFDDAIYSAMQINDNFEFIFGVTCHYPNYNVKKYLVGKDFSIYIGAPFIRHYDKTYKRLMELVNRVSNTPEHHKYITHLPVNVVLLPFVPMLQFRDILFKAEERKILDDLDKNYAGLMYHSGLTTKSLTYFAHKVPDVVSIPVCLSGGAHLEIPSNQPRIPFIPVTVPPYKK